MTHSTNDCSFFDQCDRCRGIIAPRRRRWFTLKGHEPQLIALAIVTLLAFVVILIHVLGQLHYGCIAGPKPLGWNAAQYATYLKSACSGH